MVTAIHANMVFIPIAVALTGGLIVVGVLGYITSLHTTNGYSALDGASSSMARVKRLMFAGSVMVAASGLLLAATWVQYKDTEKLRQDFDDSDIGALARDVANLSSMLVSNLAQDSVDKSILTTHGTQLTALQGTCYVCNNLIENPVYACWDTNEDGLCTLPGEDKNNDGNCTASDCHGLDGHACWDLDADRVCDLVTEDKNNDGQCTAEDCVGAPGTHGTNGTSGAQGFHCWDLNENRACDLGTEDINLDGNCTVADCTHYANGSIELVNAAGAYIDFKLLEDTDYDVRLQHVQHGFHLTTGGSGSAQLGMVLDANGRVGLGTRTPSYDVHIVDDTIGYNQIRVHSNHTSGRAGISLYQNTATSDFVMQHSTSGAGFLHNRGGNLTIMANSLHFFSNDAPVTEAIHVTSTGAIGFGVKHTGAYPYKFAGTVNAPTLVSSICTTSTVSSQTSGLALQSGATPGAGAEITLFGDGTQSNTAYFDAGVNVFRGLNGATTSGLIKVFGNDEALRLVGNTFVNLGLYRTGEGSGRSARIGYAGAGETTLKIDNQVSGGSLELNTNGGDITLNSPTAVYGGIAVHSDSFPQLLVARQSDPTKTFSLNVNSGGTATWRASSGTLLVTDGTGAGYLTTSVDASGDVTWTPSGGDITVNGNIAITGTVDGVDISAHKTDYDAKVNQDVRTTASPSFNGLTAGDGTLDVTGHIITTGAVNHVSTHPVPNGGSDRWVKLGTLSSMAQEGRSATIRIVSNDGYHPNIYGDHEVFIRFKTYNSPASGATFSLNYYSTGWDDHFGSAYTARVKVHNTTASTFDFYVYVPAFCGLGAFYTVQHNYAPALWTHSGVDTTPPTNALAAQMFYVMQTSARFGNNVQFDTPTGFGTTPDASYRIKTSGNVHVGGNIEVTGTVDGVDVSTLQSGTLSYTLACASGCHATTPFGVSDSLQYLRIGSYYHISGHVQVLPDAGGASTMSIQFGSLTINPSLVSGSVGGRSTVDSTSASGYLTAGTSEFSLSVQLSASTTNSMWLSFSGIAVV